MNPFYQELQNQLYKRITEELNNRDTPNFTQFQYAYMQADKVSQGQIALARNLAEVRETMEQKFKLPKIPMNTYIHETISSNGALWWWPHQDDDTTGK